MVDGIWGAAVSSLPGSSWPHTNIIKANNYNTTKLVTAQVQL